jgi:hypothetical protein
MAKLPFSLVVAVYVAVTRMSARMVGECGIRRVGAGPFEGVYSYFPYGGVATLKIGLSSDDSVTRMLCSTSLLGTHALPGLCHEKRGQKVWTPVHDRRRG